MKKLFLLSFRRVGLVIVAWFSAVVLHNLLSALLGVEEALFFIIAVLILPLYLITAAIYSLVHWLKRRIR